MFFKIFFSQPVIPKTLLESPPVISSGNFFSLENSPPSLGDKTKIFFSELKQNFPKGFVF